MKHHKYLVIIIFIALLIPIISYAQSIGTKMPVGGKVIQSGKSPAIVCAAMSGPIFIRPYNLALPGPYFIRASLSGRPKSGGYILGLYSTIPDLGTCTNPETGVPIPAFELKPYGVSR
ncbi:MAG: hypothetical protein KBC11_03295 [Candidatus Pacebacteria bacterium]|jgi:hypothetical protein|nr:hypothetical protein [Candidatus Paceibacterota bacterium]